MLNRRILLSVALLATLGGCIANQGDFVKEGVSEADMKRDYQLCNAKAGKAAMSAGPNLMGVAAAAAALDECMLEKGYYKE